MPVLDGFQTAAAIRARESQSAAHQVVIALTAHACKGDEARCFAAGMDGYLTKPIDPNALMALVERH